MFTINFKGARSSKMIEFVKIEMVIYKRGFARVTKVLNVTGLYQDWDKKSQTFSGPDATSKNRLLRDVKLKYLKIGERWDSQNKDWTPVELSHYFDSDPRQMDKYISIEDTIVRLAEEISNRERYKNGIVLKSKHTAHNYLFLKSSLEKFTNSKYHQAFSKYHFRDLNEKFVQDYSVWLSQQGAKNGHRGNVPGLLLKLRGVCVYAKSLGAYSVNLDIFRYVKEKIKPRLTTPKGVSSDIIGRIEAVDRALLKKKECLWLDLFLFSYYAGGMSPIDVCLMTRDWIKGDMIIYDRTKFDKQGRAIITSKAAEIMERYRGDAYMNYVFPTIKKCNPTQEQLYGRVKRINENVNKTLHKVCEMLGITLKITWSTARSSYISKLIDAGFHPLQVAELAGNSPQTIYRYYYTYSDKDKLKAKMDEIFDE